MHKKFFIFFFCLICIPMHCTDKKEQQLAQQFEQATAAVDRTLLIKLAAAHGKWSPEDKSAALAEVTCKDGGESMEEMLERFNKKKQ